MLLLHSCRFSVFNNVLSDELRWHCSRWQLIPNIPDNTSVPARKIYLRSKTIYQHGQLMLIHVVFASKGGPYCFPVAAVIINIDNQNN